MQQQKTEQSPCGHVGFYPDSYTPLTGDETYHWCLAPTLIGHCVYTLLDESPSLTTRVVQAEGGKFHLSAVGAISEARYADGVLRFRLRYPVGQRHSFAVIGTTAPEAVEVAGQTLPPEAGGSRDFRTPDPEPLTTHHSPLTLASTEAGWRYSAERSLLVVRLEQREAGVEVTVRNVAPQLPPSLAPAEGLVNGGFEASPLTASGGAGWTADPAGRARLTEEAAAGQRALELNAVGAEGEVQAYSRHGRVVGGAEYELSAHVRLAEGDTLYKVTIQWLDAAGRHLRYDNDWAGGDRPRTYTLHGGRFRAPAEAALARLILGVQAGGRCLFDELSLKRVED
jgi:hypothetical protein